MPHIYGILWISFILVPLILLHIDGSDIHGKVSGFTLTGVGRFQGLIHGSHGGVPGGADRPVLDINRFR